MKKAIILGLTLGFCTITAAQSVQQYTSTQEETWQSCKIKLEKNASQPPILVVTGNEQGIALKAWGTTFNELDWDALQMLTRIQQDSLMYRLFAPDGDLRFTRGRIGMNANDYARSWFSCDEVAGDFELRHFNINRDKQAIIPLIRAAQKYNPALTFWASPWSPPSWMKINNDYPVVSSRHNTQDPRKDYLLFGNTEYIDEDEMKFLGEQEGKFPRRLATQDYMIQDPRYLQAYANFFCKFIQAYAKQGIPIDMVMYQNEAYSYTPYPGCAWTAEGTIRFNRDYLAPTLHRQCPGVQLYLGTFNTNRQEHVERILADTALQQCFTGIGMQWEGRQILPAIRRQYPKYHYICSESECGNGQMNWTAAEHTFFLIADNMGQGCNEWFNWNFILCDHGESPWGWRQNALIQVDSQKRTYRLTDEYFAVKHFTHAIPVGSQMVAYYAIDQAKLTAIIYRTPQGKHIAVVGNLGNNTNSTTLQIGKKYLNIQLPGHSLHTFII